MYDNVEDCLVPKVALPNAPTPPSRPLLACDLNCRLLISRHRISSRTFKWNAQAGMSFGKQVYKGRCSCRLMHTPCSTSSGRICGCHIHHDVEIHGKATCQSHSRVGTCSRVQEAIPALHCSSHVSLPPLRKASRRKTVRQAPSSRPKEEVN